MTRWENELNAAIRAARAAGDEAMKHFGPEVAVTLKSDGSPVSEVDKACEHIIVECLSKACPKYGFLSEEMGRHGPADAPFWIVDPIDGTVQYIRGNPAWAIYIALEVDGRRVLGLMYRPTHDEWAFAVRGEFAIYQGKPIQLSTARSLAEACLVHEDAKLMHDRGYGRFLDAAIAAAGRCLTTADTSGPLAIAAGEAAAMVDTGRLWDHAPAEVIIGEAGGRLTSFLGEDRIDQDQAITSANDSVHQELLDIYRRAMS